MTVWPIDIDAFEIRQRLPTGEIADLSGEGLPEDIKHLLELTFNFDYAERPTTSAFLTLLDEKKRM